MSIETPMTLVRTKVRPEWIDEFEHVNIAHYLTICDLANWAFWNQINAPLDTMAARGGLEYVIVENHVHYLSELALGAEIYVTTQALAADDKRFILFHRVYRSKDDSLAATNEAKFLGFDLTARGIAPWRAPVRARLAEVVAAHAGLGMPAQAGHGIALSRR